MVEEINAFFDRFADDVSTFNGVAVASRYHAPYIAVTTDSDAWLCNTPTEVVDYLQSLLDIHSSQGVASCKYDDLEYSSVGKSSFFASVTWTMVDKEDKVVSTWRESYNLITTESGLKIITSIDH